MMTYLARVILGDPNQWSSFFSMDEAYLHNMWMPHALSSLEYLVFATLSFILFKFWHPSSKANIQDMKLLYLEQVKVMEFLILDGEVSTKMYL